MREWIVAGLLPAVVALAGCSTAGMAAPKSRADIAASYGGVTTYAPGLEITRYPDGSGSVGTPGAQVTERWSIACGVDAMTDRSDCNFHNQIGGLFVHFGASKTPQTVCVFGHDFPGRTGQIRVDSNAPITTDREGCVAASRVLSQLKAGSAVTTRRVDWPYDYPVDATSSLAGFNEAVAHVAETISNR